MFHLYREYNSYNIHKHDDIASYESIFITRFITHYTFELFLHLY